MMTLRQTALPMAIALSLVAAPVLAGGDKPLNTSEEVTFQMLDKNKDLLITSDEIPADHELITLFAQYDANKDLKLNKNEFDEYIDEVEDVEEAE